jgi:hypothetical protein
VQPFTFVPWAWRDPGMLPGWPGPVSDFRDGEPRNEPLNEPRYEPRYDDDARSTEARRGADDEVADSDRRAAADLTGYKVEAIDGGIGSIDEATYEVGSAYLVVDTGPWIFGRRVLLPAGVVERVDHLTRTVHVDRTREQVKDSPEEGDRNAVGDYYRRGYNS